MQQDQYGAQGQAPTPTQVPSSQQSSAPPYMQTPYGRPELQPTGGFKAAWFFIGFLSGIVGIILAYACNWDRAQEVKNEALKFSAIGFVATFVIVLCFTCIFSSIFVATVEQMSRSFY